MSSKQSFDTLRQELTTQVQTFAKRQKDLETQIATLKTELATVQSEGTTAYKALKAHEATMKSLGMLASTGRGKAAKATSKKAAKKGRKKAAKKAAKKTKALTGAAAKAQALLDGGVAVQSKRGQVLKAIVAGDLDARSKEARVAFSGDDVATAAPKAKKGKKKGKKKAAKSKATAKPAKKAKKASASKATAKPEAKTKGKGKKSSNAAEGRRAVARGDRPPLKEAMVTVIGKATMSSSDVIEALEKKGWLPVSKDPKQYISFMLSSNKDVFENVSRGQYKVRATAAAEAPKATKAPKKKAAAKKASASKASNGQVEQELQDLGIGEGGNVATNPFGG